MRFLKITDLNQIERLTYFEYEMLMKAFRLRSVDEEFAYYRQAWINREVEAKKSAGKNKQKYVYSKFKDFYDYDAEIKKALEEKTEDTKDIMLRRWKEYLRKKGKKDE